MTCAVLGQCDAAEPPFQGLGWLFPGNPNPRALPWAFLVCPVGAKGKNLPGILRKGPVRPFSFLSADHLSLATWRLFLSGFLHGQTREARLRSRQTTKGTSHGSLWIHLRFDRTGLMQHLQTADFADGPPPGEGTRPSDEEGLGRRVRAPGLQMEGAPGTGPGFQGFKLETSNSELRTPQSLRGWVERR